MDKQTYAVLKKKIDNVTENIDEVAAEATDAWLSENIDPATGYVLDSTLSLDNAAPPASAVGDLKTALEARATALDALVQKMLYVDSNVYSNEYKDFCTAYGIPWIDSTPHSTKDEWIDGSSYVLDTIDGEYYKAANGTVGTETGWSRTDYIICNGASSIVFPPMPQAYGTTVNSNAWFDQNKGFVANLTLSKTETVTRSVPQNAYYFGLSSEEEALESCIEAGITPYA